MRIKSNGTAINVAKTVYQLVSSKAHFNVYTRAHSGPVNENTNVFVDSMDLFPLRDHQAPAVIDERGRRTDTEEIP